MKTYKYSWPKRDGTLGSKQANSAETLLKFISEGSGEKDRTLFAETQGQFTVMDLARGTIEAMTFAALIRSFLTEVEGLRQQSNVTAISSQESA